ncbi:MAG: hypothetical protein IPL46_30665 [Saprospiraceae bacterium]|nr:hypothetical protein [Saprospiraceae bacterium]
MINKYRNHEVNLDRIEDVDFVWNGESYAELTGKTKYYDWIIASHLIEHTPDLIGFLIDCDSILKDDGILSLVVPDKRFCFDRLRPITGLGKVIDSHIQKNRIHTVGTVAEYFLNVVRKDGRIAWDSATNGELEFVHSKDQALTSMDAVLNQGVYMDVHAWCFVPHSFRLMINDLYDLGLIPFQEVDFGPTVGCEFYVTLGRMGSSRDISRMEMLNAIEIETGGHLA